MSERHGPRRQSLTMPLLTALEARGCSVSALAACRVSQDELELLRQRQRFVVGPGGTMSIVASRDDARAALKDRGLKGGDPPHLPEPIAVDLREGAAVPVVVTAGMESDGRPEVSQEPSTGRIPEGDHQACCSTIPHRAPSPGLSASTSTPSPWPSSPGRRWSPASRAVGAVSRVGQTSVLGQERTIR